MDTRSKWQNDPWVVISSQTGAVISKPVSRAIAREMAGRLDGQAIPTTMRLRLWQEEVGQDCEWTVSLMWPNCVIVSEARFSQRCDADLYAGLKARQLYVGKVKVLADEVGSDGQPRPLNSSGMEPGLGGQ